LLPKCPVLTDFRRLPPLPPPILDAEVLGFQSQQMGHHLYSDSAQFAHSASDFEGESAQ
jgi:hypothetical protein